MKFKASDVPKIAPSVVKVNVTFAFAKNGNIPSVLIENPSDASDHIRERYPSGFNILKDRNATIVDDSEHYLFFHHDESHICSFDESKLQHGVIYDLRKGKR